MSNKIIGDVYAVQFHFIDLRDSGLEQIYVPNVAKAVKTPSGHGCLSPLISKVNNVQGSKVRQR